MLATGTRAQALEQHHHACGGMLSHPHTIRGGTTQQGKVASGHLTALLRLSGAFVSLLHAMPEVVDICGIHEHCLTALNQGELGGNSRMISNIRS